MEWKAIQDIGGWGVVVIGGIEFFRRLMRGDFVLRREHEDVIAERDQLRADARSTTAVLSDQTTAIKGLTEAVTKLNEKSGGHP